MFHTKQDLSFIFKSWHRDRSIFAIFDEKPPFWSNLDTFWAIIGHFSYSTSINDSLTIELNYLLNWISRIFFELNNILNWILGKAILNRILNESFIGKIQILNWIKLGIVNHYDEVGCLLLKYSLNHGKYFVADKYHNGKDMKLLKRNET